MSSRTATSLVLLGCLLLTGGVCQAAALDWEAFAAASGSSQDPVLMEAMAARDLDTDIAICKGVARRAAPVGGFLEALAAGHHGADAARTELLLRVLLDPLVPADMSDSEVASRLGPNMASVEALMGRIAEWRDPQLVAVLVRLCRFADPKVGLPTLMLVGTRIARDLRKERGQLTPQEVGLGLAFCDAAQRTGNMDFLQPCQQIVDLSQDAALVERARTASKVLAGP